MLLKPKKTKFAKAQKGRVSYTYRSSTLDPNVYSIVALEPARITASHIYASELAMKRKIRMGGVKAKNALHIKIFPHIPVTKKPIEVRMGKGKGKVDH
jgi:large subunit ribosomal protein L16